MSATRIVVVLCLGVVACAGALATAWGQSSGAGEATKPAGATTTSQAAGGTVTITNVVVSGSGQMTEKDEQDALNYLKAHRPEHYLELMKLKDTDPQKYRNSIRSVWWWTRSVNNLPDSVRDAFIQQQDAFLKLSDAWQELRKIDEQIAQAQAQIEKGPAAGVADPKQLAQLQTSEQEAKARIRKAIDSRFDAEQVIREYRLEQLRKQIDTMMDENRKREAQRPALVEEEANKYFASATKPATPTPSPASTPAPKSAPK